MTLFACAVRRRRFPVGASPTRRTLQPEATGAASLTSPRHISTLRTAVVHRMVLSRLPPQPRNRAEQSPDVALPGNEPRTKLTCQHIEPPSSSARLRSAP